MNRLVEREGELAVIDAQLRRRTGLLAIEGRAGIGKTSLLGAACDRAEQLGYEILRARGAELEQDFAFGIVRQLFERYLASAEIEQREALLAGSATAVRQLLLGQVLGTAVDDTSFAILHGLYWVAANVAVARPPLLLTIDDAHWADEPSLRWLTYLARRLDGLPLGMLVTLRRGEPASVSRSLLALCDEAPTILRPALLSESASIALVQALAADMATDELCRLVWNASGGNPFYLKELVRAIEFSDRRPVRCATRELLVAGQSEIAPHIIDRVRGLNPGALDLAQALAVLGDGCELRWAATLAGMDMLDAKRLAAGLVRREVLAADDPPRFMHPVVREAIETSLASDQRDAAHLAAARLLHANQVPAGQIAAHLAGVRAAGDPWVLARLREAAQIAMNGGAPQIAASLLGRALVEPPPAEQRVSVLRELARAEVSAGREAACLHLDEALRLTTDRYERAQIALEIAEMYAALFRWTDAVDVLERARAELGDVDETLATRLEGELVVCALHDARRAARAGPALRRLSSYPLVGRPAEAFSVARGMAMILAGQPAKEAASHLEEALAHAGGQAENWDTRAALLWSLIVAERFEVVAAALEPMVEEVRRCGSARGFVATYSTLGLLKLRIGALPEADSASRVALRVLQEGDFQPGLAFAATVLADIAIEAGELDDAQSLLALLPQEGWPAGVGTVLIPAARGRLRLAQARPAEALADFQTCAEMFSPKIWGTEMRDVGYLHTRAGAAQALVQLGESDTAWELARAELQDVRLFGTPRALGIALRVAGLAHGGQSGIELLSESVATLRISPALLERAHSLVELGSALRRSGHRATAGEPLSEGLDLAARCGARALTARAREELKALGARPRRDWRTGLEALTPSELRIIHLAAEERSNREIAHHLYVTLKTVEGHLSRAYTKLGISGRGQLLQILAGEKMRVGNRKN